MVTDQWLMPLARCIISSQYVNWFALLQGGPYLEKMHRDHTEMLYWLQQERRHDILRVATQQLVVK